MNKLFNELPQDEQYEDEGIYQIGDALANQFYNGNWLASVELMTENYYTCTNLIDFLTDEDTEFEGQPYGGFFDYAFFAELGASTVKFN